MTAGKGSCDPKRYYKGPKNPKVTVKWQLFTCPSCPTLDKLPQSGRGRKTGTWVSDTGYHLVPQPWPVVGGQCEKQPGSTAFLSVVQAQRHPKNLLYLVKTGASFVKG